MGQWLSVRLEGGKTLNTQLDRLKADIPIALRDAIRGIANDTRNTAMDSFLQPKSGRVYRPGTAKEHRASAPGEPPASDSGDLLGHVTVAARGKYTDVGAEVLHGLYLEEGTKVQGVWHVEPRPWLLPAYEEHEHRVESAIVRHLGRL